MKDANIGKLLERIATRRSETPGFEICMMRVVQRSFLYEVAGSVPRLLTRGPRKGEKVWQGGKQTFFITSEQLEAEAIAYEAETGNCANCFGRGEVFESWNRESGTKYRPCRCCGATGKRSAA